MVIKKSEIIDFETDIYRDQSLHSFHQCLFTR